MRGVIIEVNGWSLIFILALFFVLELVGILILKLFYFYRIFNFCLPLLTSFLASNCFYNDTNIKNIPNLFTYPFSYFPYVLNKK